jgi:hypothetical protein
VIKVIKLSDILAQKALLFESKFLIMMQFTQNSCIIKVICGFGTRFYITMPQNQLNE